MNNFESGFTYDDLEKATPGEGSEQLMAKGLTTMSNEEPPEENLLAEDVYGGLGRSGVEIVESKPFFADGTPPQLNAK